MTPEEKARAYDKTISKLQSLIANANKQGHIIVRVEDIENTFPELKESEDEKIKKAICNALKYLERELSWDFLDDVDILDAYEWLEKQSDKDKLIKELGEYKVKYTQEVLEKHLNNINNKDNERLRKTTIAFLKDFAEQGYENAVECIDWLKKQCKQNYIKKDVDDAYLQGISDTKNEMEKQYEANYQIRKDIATFIFNYRGVLKDRAKWMDYLGIKAYFVQEQDKQNPQPTLTPKSAIEAAKEEKVDNQNCVKPAEPKFHEGDWIVKKGTIYRIDKISGVYITLSTIDGTALVYHKSVLCSERIHRWTIEDAKDGDVLSSSRDVITTDKSVFIYAKVLYNKPYAYCGVDKYGVFKDNCLENNWTNSVDNIHPATKEQCDLLFKKMEESGYEWDAEKKELKKIEDEPENYKKQVMSEITDLVKDYIEQKSTWSEEDEKKLSDILAILRGGENCYYNSPILMDWLKSLKERIGG